MIEFTEKQRDFIENNGANLYMAKRRLGKTTTLAAKFMHLEKQGNKCLFVTEWTKLTTLTKDFPEMKNVVSFSNFISGKYREKFQDLDFDCILFDCDNFSDTLGSDRTRLNEMIDKAKSFFSMTLDWRCPSDEVTSCTPISLIDAFYFINDEVTRRADVYFSVLWPIEEGEEYVKASDMFMTEISGDSFVLRDHMDGGIVHEVSLESLDGLDSDIIAAANRERESEKDNIDEIVKVTKEIEALQDKLSSLLGERN